MKTLYQTEVFLTFDAMANRQRPVVCKNHDFRSDGVHLSGILKYLAVTGGIMQDYGDFAAEDVPLADRVYAGEMADGVAWEEFAISLYPQIAWQPGELCRDEIYGTPDGIGPSTFDESILCYHEFKDTSKKRQPIEDIWMYTRQGLGYCAMSGGLIRHVEYHVKFNRGDYGAKRRAYDKALIEFSESEIEKFWNGSILKYKDRAKAEKH